MAEPVSLIDEILAEVGSDEALHEFSPATAPGRRFRCKVLRSADDLSAGLKRMRRFQKMSTANTPPAWHPYVPVGVETSRTLAYAEASHLEVRAGDDTWQRLSTLDMLKLAKGAGALFLEIGGEVMSAQLGAQATRDEEALDELGEG